MMNKHLFALLGLSLLVATACSEGNPVAPNGTILTVTASPNRIGRTATATITVSGRKPDGNPIAQGTDIFFSTTLGSIVRQLKADNQGRAIATLVGDGRIGTAEVTVSLDGSTGGGTGGDGGTGGGTATGTNTVTVSVQVGSVPTVVVNINPDNLQVTQQARVTVIAQNEDGAPVERETVTLVTNLGTLNPSNPTLNENGVAESTLRAGVQAGTATVRAFVAGVSAEGTATIRDVITQLALTASPNRVATDDPVNIVITAIALNAQNQPVPGSSVLFVANPNIGVFSPSSAGTTNSGGAATVTLRLEQTDLRTFTSVDVTGQVSGVVATVTISLPGPPP